MDRYKKMEVEKIRCSFCDKNQQEVVRLIGGPVVFICDQCVNLCVDVLKEDDANSISLLAPRSKPMSPSRIKAVLDTYVIGQEHAKRTLSVAIYNHYKRLQHLSDASGVEISKSNILLIGPTGCGKTLLAKTLAKILEVPFAIADATTLTQAGYVGEDVENIILRLLQAADNDLEAAKRGVIFIDEIDKISRKSESSSITRDVSGEGVQQALLKLIEGTIASVPSQGGRKHPQQEYIRFDTKDVLVIVGGAFFGLEAIIRRRKKKSTAMGFSATLSDKILIDSGPSILHEVENDDLLAYGMIPEFIGRFSIIVCLDDLNEEDLLRILEEPKDSLIKQYETLLHMDGVALTVTQEAKRAIVKEAKKRKTGARGLRSIMDKVLLEPMYTLPDDGHTVSGLVVDEEAISGASVPKKIHKTETEEEKRNAS